MLLLMSYVSGSSLYGQPGGSSVEYGACPVKVGEGLVVRCGYLVAPENRSRPGGAKVKIPFIFVRKVNQSATKNITLFSTGGPGNSTIAGIDSIGSNTGWTAYGGFIAFDQRGSRRCIPSLACDAVPEAIRRSYREGLNRDSLVRQAVSECRAGFAAKGIDLSAYNTIESAEDINDLRLALHLDSLNLLGISYSGGLMLTVARNHPEAVRNLILGSPLPGFVNYEENALFNINEALDRVFDYYEADSLLHRKYGDLRKRFRDYFTGITGQTFSMNYRDKEAGDSINVQYGKDELMEAILDGMTASGLKYLPGIINDITTGKHSEIVSRVLDGRFALNQPLSHGMRYSIYCTEQIAYADTALIRRQEKVLPWLAGFPFNNVDHAICDCWKTKAELPVAKTPVYSAVPALVVGGDIDPWCSPFYNRLIRRTMPNAQVLLFRKRGHVPGYGADGVNYLDIFLKHPYQKIRNGTETVMVE